MKSHLKTRYLKFDWLRPAFAILLAFAAYGCSGVPIQDRYSNRAQQDGYFLSGDDAKARGGVGNYAPRGCTAGGFWGGPVDCRTGRTAMDDSIDMDAASTLPVDLRVHFNTASASLSAADRKALRDWARMNDPGKDGHLVHVWISGYADSRGGEPMNQRLSEARANAVKRELAQVLPRAQIVVDGEGEIDGTSREPYASEARRVEVFGDVDTGKPAPSRESAD